MGNQTINKPNETRVAPLGNLCGHTAEFTLSSTVILRNAPRRKEITEFLYHNVKEIITCNFLISEEFRLLGYYAVWLL
jgi:hypothetical protein